ncbi:MAG: OmpA family protein [Endomicrobium sp.]|nr:OmpA family protein [Endomicrobium sp.]
MQKSGLIRKTVSRAVTFFFGSDLVEVNKRIKAIIGVNLEIIDIVLANRVLVRLTKIKQQYPVVGIPVVGQVVAGAGAPPPAPEGEEVGGAPQATPTPTPPPPTPTPLAIPLSQPPGVRVGIGGANKPTTAAVEEVVPDATEVEGVVAEEERARQEGLTVELERLKRQFSNEVQGQLPAIPAVDVEHPIEFNQAVQKFREAVTAAARSAQRGGGGIAALLGAVVLGGGGPLGLAVLVGAVTPGIEQHYRQSEGRGDFSNANISMSANRWDKSSIYPELEEDGVTIKLRVSDQADETAVPPLLPASALLMPTPAPTPENRILKTVPGRVVNGVYRILELGWGYFAFYVAKEIILGGEVIEHGLFITGPIGVVVGLALGVLDFKAEELRPKIVKLLVEPLVEPQEDFIAQGRTNAEKLEKEAFEEKQKGNYEKAEELYEKARDIYTNIYDSKNGDDTYYLSKSQEISEKCYVLFRINKLIDRINKLIERIDVEIERANNEKRLALADSLSFLKEAAKKVRVDPEKGGADKRISRIKQELLFQINIDREIKKVFGLYISTESLKDHPDYDTLKSDIQDLKDHHVGKEDFDEIYDRIKTKVERLRCKGTLQYKPVETGFKIDDSISKTGGIDIPMPLQFNGGIYLKGKEYEQRETPVIRPCTFEVGGALQEYWNSRTNTMAGIIGVVYSNPDKPVGASIFRKTEGIDGSDSIWSKKYDEIGKRESFAPCRFTGPSTFPESLFATTQPVNFGVPFKDSGIFPSDSIWSKKYDEIGKRESFVPYIFARPSIFPESLFATTQPVNYGIGVPFKDSRIFPPYGLNFVLSEIATPTFIDVGDINGVHPEDEGEVGGEEKRIKSRIIYDIGNIAYIESSSGTKNGNYGRDADLVAGVKSSSILDYITYLARVDDPERVEEICKILEGVNSGMMTTVLGAYRDANDQPITVPEDYELVSAKDWYEAALKRDPLNEKNKEEGGRSREFSFLDIDKIIDSQLEIEKACRYPNGNMKIDGDKLTYHITGDLEEMKYGIFRLLGIDASYSIVSGEGKHSFMKMTAGNAVSVGEQYKFNVKGVTIRDMYTEGNGSGLRVTNGGAEVYVENMIYENNRSKGSGGAIYIKGQEEGKEHIFKDTKFINNVAGNDGGGLYVEDSKVTFYTTKAGGTVFKGNRAGGKSSAFYIGKGSRIIFATEEGEGVDIYDSLRNTVGGDRTLSFKGKGEVRIHNLENEIPGTHVNIEGKVRLRDGANWSEKEMDIHESAILDMEDGNVNTVKTEEKMKVDGTIKIDVFEEGRGDRIEAQEVELCNNSKLEVVVNRIFDESEVQLITGQIKGEFGEIVKGALIRTYMDYITGKLMIKQGRLRNMEGLTRNERSLAEALDEIVETRKGAVYKLILKMTNLKDEDLKRAIGERSGYFIANVIRSGGNENDSKWIYDKMGEEGDREIKEGYRTNKGVWGQLKRNYTKYGEGQENEYKDSETGGMIGYDSYVSRDRDNVWSKVKMGVYGNVGKNSLRQGDDDGEIAKGGMGVYGGYIGEKLEIKGIMSGNYNIYSTEREIKILERGKAKADFNGIGIGIDIEGARKIRINDNVRMRMYGGIEGGVSGYEDIKEKGVEISNLRVKRGNYNRMLMRVGVGITKEIEKVRIGGNVEYKRILIGEEPRIENKIGEEEKEFEIKGTEEGKDIVGMGLRGSYQISRDISVNASANFYTAKGYENVQCNLGTSYRFGGQSLGGQSSKIQSPIKVERKKEVKKSNKKEEEQKFEIKLNEVIIIPEEEQRLKIGRNIKEGEEIADWKVYIKDAMGKVVKVYEGAGEEEGVLEWEGREGDKGKILPEGIYSITLEVTDKKGRKVVSESKEVRLMKKPKIENTKIKGTERGLEIALNSEVLFDTGESGLKLMSKKVLNKVAELMTIYKKNKILVEGHSDGQGEEKFNQRLSELRAESVKEYLKERGVEEGRIKTIGCGKRKPVATNKTKAGRKENRRVEIVVLKESM